MEFYLSDFPVCKDLLDTDGDVETDSGQGALTEDDCIVMGDSVLPSDSDNPCGDPYGHLLNPNFSCQITTCEQSLATMADLEKDRVDTHVSVNFTIPPSSCDNNEDLKSRDQSSGTNEHETHISGDDSETENIKEKGIEETENTKEKGIEETENIKEKGIEETENIKENRIEENSDGRSTVHWKDDPAVHQRLAKLLISAGISDRIANRRPTPYWPDHLQSMGARMGVITEAYEMETENTNGQIEEGGHTDQWRNAFLLLAALILVNMVLQKFSVICAFSRCTAAAAWLSSASYAALMTCLRGWDERFPRAVRPIGGGLTLVRQFFQTIRCVLPHIPVTPAAQSIYVITATAVIVFLIWKFLTFRRFSDWNSTSRTFLRTRPHGRPRPRPRPRQNGLNRAANAEDRDHDHGRNGEGSDRT